MPDKTATAALRANTKQTSGNSKASGKKKKKNKGRKAVSVMLLIGFVIAACILIYPTFMDALYNLQQTAMIGAYEAYIDELDPETIKRLKEEATAYNAKIFQQQQIAQFTYQGANYTDPEYDAILKISDDSAVMCYIDIPYLGIYLPVTHGTRTEDLEYMIGHMRGTSVPIGGPSTHAVLAGHTGLTTADLFTHIDKMEVGDYFYIHVLDEIHVYNVDQINVVEPTKESPYIQVEEGQDYVTLFTCTPYGINDHRLLVRGVRSYPDLERNGQTGDTGLADMKNIKAWLEVIGWGLIPFAILALGLWWLFGRKKKKKKTKTNALLPKCKKWNIPQTGNKRFNKTMQYTGRSADRKTYTKKRYTRR